jgi:hypothetical protein
MFWSYSSKWGSGGAFIQENVGSFSWGKVCPLKHWQKVIGQILCIMPFETITIGLIFVNGSFQIHFAPWFIRLLLLWNLWALTRMARFWYEWNKDHFQAQKRQVISFFLFFFINCVCVCVCVCVFVCVIFVSKNLWLNIKVYLFV